MMSIPLARAAFSTSFIRVALRQRAGARQLDGVIRGDRGLIDGRGDREAGEAQLREQALAVRARGGEDE